MRQARQRCVCVRFTCRLRRYLRLALGDDDDDDDDDDVGVIDGDHDHIHNKQQVGSFAVESVWIGSMHLPRFSYPTEQSDAFKSAATVGGGGRRDGRRGFALGARSLSC